MTYVFAVVLALHGLVHVLGFVSVWRIGGGVMPMAPTLLADLDPDGLAMRGIGVLWLLPVALFGIAAVGLALEAPWWRTVLVPATVVSLLLCVAWWNDAKVGATFDVAILVGMIGAAWAAQGRA